MQKQVDAKRMKLGQERHKVFQAAAQAIDVPSHHYFELALGGDPAQRVERRPAIAALSATDAVILVDPRHLPAGPLCRSAQLVLLAGRGLVLRRYLDRSRRVSWLRPIEDRRECPNSLHFVDSISVGFLRTACGIA